MLNNKLTLGLSSLALLVLTACTSMPLTSEISDAIANATTAADHQRIANYFSEKAVSYEAEASWHEKMVNSYGGYPRAYVSHCQSLQEGFSAAAKDARALEQAHRQLAAGARI